MLIADSGVFARAVFLMAAEKLSHQQTTQPRAAHHFSTDQHADETMIFVAPALIFVAAAFFLFAATSFIEALAEQVGQHQAPQATATHHSGTHQQAHQLTIILARTFFAAFLGLLAAMLLGALAKQMSQQETTQAPTSHNTAADQHAHDTALFIGAAFAFPFLALAFLAAFFHAVVKYGGHEKTAQATTAQAAANQQTHKALLFRTAFLAFVLAFATFE